MARHRNVRSMNYTDEYDGYDDVYGHSVEEDFCVSPSDAAFLYNREGSKNQLIGAFIKDTGEEGEQKQKPSESEIKELESCIAQLKLVLGTSTPQQEMAKVLLENNLDVDKALNVLLDNVPTELKQVEKKDKGDKFQYKHFSIPKLDTLKIKHVLNICGEGTHELIKYNTYVNPQKTFTSLSELSNAHLKNKNVLDRSLNKTKKSPRKDQGIPNIDVGGARSHFAEKILNIDLTKALKKNRLEKCTSSTNKRFNYSSISCQEKLEDFNCRMDISFVLGHSSDISKKVSEFGKILCYKPKKNDAIIITSMLQCSFSFEGFSPDDRIHLYLKAQ